MQTRSFPIYSAEQVRDYLTGKNLDKVTAIDAGYDLLGFALAGAHIRAASRAGMPSQQAIVGELENMIKTAHTQTQAFAQTPTVGKTDDESEIDKSKPTGRIDSPDYFVPFILQFLTRLTTT